MMTPYPHLQANPRIHEVKPQAKLSEEEINAIRKSGVAPLIEKLKRCNFQSAELNKAIKDLDMGAENAMTSFIEVFSSGQFNIFFPI